jgi:hypothetical protein
MATMTILTAQDKVALRVHTQKLADTYDEIKSVFKLMTPAAAKAACEQYQNFATTRPALVEQQKHFKAMRDAVFQIDKEAADLYDLAMVTNKKTLELIDRLLKKAREFPA